MIIFNGKLVITSCEQVGVTGVVWAVEANFSDNTGVFTAKDIRVSDAVYVSGTDFAGNSNYCGYIVTKVDEEKTTVTKFAGELTYAEEYELIDDVGVPDVYVDGMICRVSSKSGFAMIPTDSSGLPQSLLDTARNISLVQRDYNVSQEITTIVQETASSDGSKLSTSGGTVTGDLEVTGDVVAGTLAVKDGTKNRVKVDSSSLTVALEGTTAQATLSVNGTQEATTAEVVTAGNTVTASRTLNAGETVVDTVNVGGDVVSRVVQLQGLTRGTWGVTVNGNTTAAGITAAGSTEATVNVTALTTSPSGSSRVNLKASTVTADGAFRVTDDAQFDGGVTAAGTVRGSKFFASSTDTVYQDTQLVTYQYLRQYLVDQLAAQTTAVNALLDEKADAADVYTKAEVDAMVSSSVGNGGDLTVNAAYQTGTFTADEVANDQLVTKAFVSDFVSASIGTSTLVDDIAALQRAVDTKANAAEVYTATEVDTIFLGLKHGDIETDENGRFVTDYQIDMWTNKQDALGFTPEDAAQKGQANGYAALDGNGQVEPSQLVGDPIVSLINVNTEPETVKPSTRLVLSGTPDNSDGLFKSFRLYVSDGTDVYEADSFSTYSKTKVNFSQVVNLPTILDSIVTNNGVGVNRVLPDPDEDKRIEPGVYSSVAVDNRGIVYRGENPEYLENLKGTFARSWSVGNNKRESIYIMANVGGPGRYPPFIRYNALMKYWEVSHDGYSTYILGDSALHLVRTIRVDFGYVAIFENPEENTPFSVTGEDFVDFAAILGRDKEDSDMENSFDLGLITDAVSDTFSLDALIEAETWFTVYFKSNGLI